MADTHYFDIHNHVITGLTSLFFQKVTDP